MCISIYLHILDKVQLHIAKLSDQSVSAMDDDLDPADADALDDRTTAREKALGKVASQAGADVWL